MSSPQAKGMNLKEFKTDDLKRIIALQHREILVKNERLKGVEGLTRICSDLEEKSKGWQNRAENFETALRRAETRIAILNKKLGIGPQAAFGVDVVYPGVSRKDFDAVTRENIRLKEQLEHIVATGLGGQDVISKNRELYELVATLKDDISQRDHHIKELEETVSSNGEGLAARVNELTKHCIKLERSINAKQVFSENLLKENKRLRETLEHGKMEVVNEMQLGSQDVPDGPARDGMNTQLTEDTSVSAKNSVSNEEYEALVKSVEEKEKLIAEQLAMIRELQAEIERSSAQVDQLTTEIEKANQNKTKAESELTETVKKSADYQKKCAGFFNQVVSLNSKQQESEEEISALKRTNENLRADVEERKAMVTMMRDSLKTYEDDFRRESEEKAGYEKRFKTAQQDTERLRRENQSHMATIRHFESEIERMSKLLNEERSRKNTTSGFHSAFGQAFGTTATRSIFQDRTPGSGLTVADGPSGGGVNETYSKPSEPPKSSPTLIECPYCSRSYPYHLIEGHVQDCMEDSLYMDD